MKILIQSGFLALLFAFVVGCAQAPTQGMPNWIENPKRSQAVGSCGAHALGKYKQKECAMTRARLELAARQGVQIKSLSLMSEQASSMRSSSTLNQQTIQEVNSKIRARLVDSYHDKAQDILWVLMEEN